MGVARILVVDDDPRIRDVLRRGLTYEGFAVDTAGSGEEALRLAREQSPDLVILDILMPGLDGYEVLRRLRAADPQLPILMLTARDAPADHRSPAAGRAQVRQGVLDDVGGLDNTGGRGPFGWFTINGKAFPAVPEWVVRVRLVNISNLAHPMHLHGHDFKVVAKDGEPIRPEAQQVMNTLTVNPGETYDIVFVADNPGVWVFHCHELHHTENDGVEPGGLIQVIRYGGSPGGAAPQPTPTMPARMPGMGH